MIQIKDSEGLIRGKTLEIPVSDERRKINEPDNRFTVGPPSNSSFSTGAGKKTCKNFDQRLMMLVWGESLLELLKDTGASSIQTVTFLMLPLLGAVTSSHQHRHLLRSHLPILFLHQEIKLGFLTDLTFHIKRQCMSGHSRLLFFFLCERKGNM